MPNEDDKSRTMPINVPGDREKLLEKLKRETSRLSLSDAHPPTRNLPKTIQLKRPQTAGSEQVRPGTTKKSATTITRPASTRAAPPVKKSETGKLREAPTVARQPSASKIIDSLDAAISEDMKKVTSRILLEDIIPTEHDVDPKMTTMPVAGLKKPPSTRITSAVPKTIKLKRPSLSSVARRPDETQSRPPTKPPSRKVVPSKIETSPIGEAPTIIKKTPGQKRETSVITVGDTIAKPATQRKQTSKIPEAEQPGTIKLKRSASAPAPDETTDLSDKKSETAKISLPSQPSPSTLTPVTQRKTIKIKRSERNVSAAPSVVAQSRIFQKKAEEPVVEDTISILFSIVAILAVLFAGCLVYILAAQAFAPDLMLPVPGLN